MQWTIAWVVIQFKVKVYFSLFLKRFSFEANNGCAFSKFELSNVIYYYLEFFCKDCAAKLAHINQHFIEFSLKRTVKYINIYADLAFRAFHKEGIAHPKRNTAEINVNWFMLVNTALSTDLTQCHKLNKFIQFS